jgi:hypothetical protein
MIGGSAHPARPRVDAKRRVCVISWAGRHRGGRLKGLARRSGTASALAIAALLAAAVADARASRALRISAGGEVTGALYPGGPSQSIPVTLSNPTGETIYFTHVAASVGATGSGDCLASWFRTTAADIPQGGIAVRPRESVTLPVEGVAGPAIRMLESGTNQDACQATRLTVRYTTHPRRGATGPVGSAPQRGGSGTGSLPFTGLLVGALALAGAILGGAGLALRRRVAWSGETAIVPTARTRG